MRKFTRFAVSLGVMMILASLAPGVARAKTTKVGGEFYDVIVTTNTAKGKQAAVISAKGKGGYKCNKKYPWKLTIEPAKEGGEKTVLKKADAKKLAEDEVIFEVVSTSDTGKETVAQLKLSMCDEKQCKMATVDLSW